MSRGHSTVFAVIPVFNRVGLTRQCLNSLRPQTYSRLVVIVVDGGSTDGTPAILKREYPECVVLEGREELWWTGAMHKGIEHVLARSRVDDDRLLMMNNDSLVGPDYVETLVRVSRETGAAVGALIVDSLDASRILDAGESIDWSAYTFPVKTAVGVGETFFDQVDVLPGRGTLVPLWMIRSAGNVNAKAFPHYIGDYEFFCRLRKHGFRLGVSYQAVLMSHTEETGLSVHSSRLTFREAWNLLFSNKSMYNVRDHWRFIDYCAPAELRKRVKVILIKRLLSMVVLKTWLGYAAFPFVWLSHWIPEKYGRLRSL